MYFNQRAEIKMLFIRTFFYNGLNPKGLDEFFKHNNSEKKLLRKIFSILLHLS